MQDISGFGLRVIVNANPTFPQGLVVTQFADDADPLDNPSQQIVDKAMGLNGDLVTWSKANPILATLNVIPDSDDDRNLAALAEANRVARNKGSAQDVVTMTVLYPDGRTVTLGPGKLTDAMLASGIASGGRRKSKTYGFAFESMQRSN